MPEIISHRTLGLKISGFKVWWLWHPSHRWDKREWIMFEWTLYLMSAADLTQLKVGQSVDGRHDRIATRGALQSVASDTFINCPID